MFVGEWLGSIKMIMSFVSNFFFFLPHSLVFFYLWEAAGELRTERKKQEYFYTQILFGGSRLFCGENVFLNQ